MENRNYRRILQPSSTYRYLGWLEIMAKKKQQVGAVTEPKRKTTYALPVSVLERLRIHSAVLGEDRQDVVAKVLDKNLPQYNFPLEGTTA